MLTQPIHFLPETFLNGLEGYHKLSSGARRILTTPDFFITFMSKIPGGILTEDEDFRISLQTST